MNVIMARNAPHAYTESLWKMRVWAKEEMSRNGAVMTSTDPVLLEIEDPTERVLFDPVRNANPFFHCMEFIWMVAGSNDVRWLEVFNKRYREYADPGTDTVHAAYGHRWRSHFGVNQIVRVVEMLRKDPTTRRAVIGMWDPEVDLEQHNDLPCNTHIYFRVVNERLNMTVCNRSNDLIWGMLGANVVHMTMLQELIASAVESVALGRYSVFTNNLHVYRSLPNFEQIWNTTTPFNAYREVAPAPLLLPGETLEMFLEDAMNFIDPEWSPDYNCHWFTHTAHPMREAYYDRKFGRGTGLEWARKIDAEDWRLACLQWIQRKEDEK